MIPFLSSSVIARSALVVFARVFKLICGMVWVIGVARIFGVSTIMDMWVLYFGIFSSITLLIWGPITEVYRVRFLKKLGSEDGASTLQDYFNVIWQIFVVSVILTSAFFIVVIICFVVFNVRLVPNLQLSLILAPYISINVGFVLLCLVANCIGYDIAPDVLFGVSQVLCLPLLYATYPVLGIWSLVLCNYLMLFLPVFIILYILFRSHVSLERLKLNKFKDLVEMLHHARSLYAVYSVGQLTALSERSIAFIDGPGSASIYNYTNQIRLAFQSVFQSVVNIVLLPIFVRIIKGESQIIASKKASTLILPYIFGVLLLISPFFLFRDVVISRIFLITKPTEMQIAVGMYELFLLAAVFISVNLFYNSYLIASGRITLVSFSGVCGQLVTIVGILYFGTLSSIPLSIFCGSLVATGISMTLGSVHSVPGWAVQFAGLLFVLIEVL